MVWVVGPEVKVDHKATRPPVIRSAAPNLQVHLRRARLREFLTDPELKATNWRTSGIVFGFNCGFGNFVETTDFGCEAGEVVKDGGERVVRGFRH